MRIRSFLLAASAAVVVAPAAASAQGLLLPTIPSTGCAAWPSRVLTPIARMIVDGQCFDLTSSIIASPTLPGKIWTLSLPNPLTVPGIRLEQLTVTYDADPSITFSGTTTNLDADNTVAFLFGTPIEPGQYTNVSSEGRVAITSGVTGAGGVEVATALQPTFIAGFGTAAQFGTPLGVDIGTAACSSSGGTAGVANNCDFGTRANTFGATFFDNLEVQLVYRQTGLGSIATFTGSVTLAPTATPNPSVVPEPATVGLVATGLVGVLLAGRRKRRAPTA